MRSGEIVEALPFVELGVEELGVVDDLAGEAPIDLFVAIRCDRSTLPLSRGVDGRM